MRFDISALLNPKARSLLGLDISSSAVKLVELSSSGKDAYRVERYTIEVLPKDAVSDGNITNMDAVVDAVSRAWKRLQTSTRHVAMALPAAAVITKKIILPSGMYEAQFEMQVEAEAQQYIPFAIDEVSLDFQVLGPLPNSAEDVGVFIAAAKKERVEDRVAVANAAGLQVAVMDVESLATLAAFELIQHQLPDGGKDQIVALIDAGAHIMGLSVLRNGEQVYAREQAFGGAQLTQDVARFYGMGFEEAEAAKRSGSLPEGYEAELLQPFLELLALEVSRALQFFFTSTQYNHVDHIVLAGGCAQIPGADEVVATRTQVNTVIANPFAEMAVSDRVRARALMADAASMMIACGLALRRFDQS